jgi:glutathione S-transferase
MADFTFFEAVDFFNWITEGKLTETYPNLAAYHKRVASLPGIAEFLSTDRSKRRFNNKSAKLNDK